MPTAKQTTEQDIAVARAYYREILQLAARMDLAGDRMSNRGHWLNAIYALRKNAAEALEHFIGERTVKDITIEETARENERWDAAQFAAQQGEEESDAREES
jgi:hypothetical protein